jgi:3-oxoacyl-[acyl-carrier protein] reductase
MVAAASKGIGRAVALALAREGCRVSMCARNPEALQNTRREIAATAGDDNTAAVCADVSIASDIERWFLETEKSLGAPDILVTNTGGPPARRFLELTDEQWQAGVDSTLMNVVRMVRLAAPGMMERGWGRIVHITSLVARQGIDDLTISSTLRSGISALTRLQSNQFAAHGVLVNAVLPGNTLTDRAVFLAETRARAQGITTQEALEQAGKQAPVGRLATPEEIAEPVAFLCSQRASYITGISVLVDGGLCRGPY